MEIKRNDINFERIAIEVRRDGEVCDTDTVKRMFESLDSDGKSWTGSATAKEVEAWAIGVLCNSQPLIIA